MCSFGEWYNLRKNLNRVPVNHRVNQIKSSRANVRMADVSRGAKSVVGHKYVHMGDKSPGAKSVVVQRYAHMVDESPSAKSVVVHKYAHMGG